MLTEFHQNINNEDSYYGLLVSIEANQGRLNLLLAVCDNSDFREQIIQQYEQELDASIPKYRVKLAAENPSLTSNIRELVARNPELKSYKNAVITVTGTEQFRFLPQQQDSVQTPEEQFLGYLQWTREALREFPYSIVLWINFYLEVQISKKAPDFWSWRKGVFRFISPTKNIVNITPFSLDFNQETSSLLSLEDLQELIEDFEKNQGKKPLLATLYSNLGNLYRERTVQGKSINYTEEQSLAIEYLQKAIALQKEFNLEIDLASSLNNLGEIYYKQGKYDQAESLFIQSLNIRKNIFGEKDFDTAQSLNNLALLYQNQRKYKKSESLLFQSLEIMKNILGENHPDIAKSLNNLAGIYLVQRKYEQAEPLLIQSLEIMRKILGENNPDVAKVLNNLAELCQSQGKYEEAESLYIQSLEIMKKISGENHHNTKTVENSFSNFIQQVITEGKESILSNDPLTQSLLKELKS